MNKFTENLNNLTEAFAENLGGFMEAFPLLAIPLSIVLFPMALINKVCK